jgi:hypothetical protein
MEDLALAVVLIDKAVKRGSRRKGLDIRKEIIHSELKKLERESVEYWFALALRKRLKEMTTNGKT